METKIRYWLNFFRILDENGDVSLTNIAVIVVIIKMAVAPALDMAAVAGILTVLSSYSFKRYTQRKHRNEKRKVDLADVETLAKLQSEVNRIKVAQGWKANENSR